MMRGAGIEKGRGISRDTIYLPRAMCAQRMPWPDCRHDGARGFASGHRRRHQTGHGIPCAVVRCKPERYHNVMSFCGGSSSFLLCLSARSLLSGGACLKMHLSSVFWGGAFFFLSGFKSCRAPLSHAHMTCAGG